MAASIPVLRPLIQEMRTLSKRSRGTEKSSTSDGTRRIGTSHVISVAMDDLEANADDSDGILRDMQARRIMCTTQVDIESRSIDQTKVKAYGYL
jgi:hypothetical protein